MSLAEIVSDPQIGIYLLSATNDGAFLGALNVLIEIEIKAWERDPFSSVSSVIPASKVDLERLSQSLVELKLEHDIETNPGPLLFSTVCIYSVNIVTF
jgi:hypothetical protein